jgi:hypothetical protein
LKNYPCKYSWFSAGLNKAAGRPYGPRRQMVNDKWKIDKEKFKNEFIVLFNLKESWHAK